MLQKKIYASNMNCAYGPLRSQACVYAHQKKGNLANFQQVRQFTGWNQNCNKSKMTRSE